MDLVRRTLGKSCVPRPPSCGRVANGATLKPPVKGKLSRAGGDRRLVDNRPKQERPYKCKNASLNPSKGEGPTDLTEDPVVLQRQQSFDKGPPAGVASPSLMGDRREAFLEHLKQKYPQHTAAIMGHQERLRQQSKTKPAQVEKVELITVSSMESQEGVLESVASPPFVRGIRSRASLPVVRATNQTKDRSMGTLYLQYGDETKTVKMPNQISSRDTVRALFVSAFPQQLSLQILESPAVALCMRDDARNLYYELSDMRSITDRSYLKVYHKDPAQAFSHNSRTSYEDTKVHSISSAGQHSMWQHPPLTPTPGSPVCPSQIPFGPHRLPSSSTAHSSSILERRDVKPDEDVGQQINAEQPQSVSPTSPTADTLENVVGLFRHKSRRCTESQLIPKLAARSPPRSPHRAQEEMTLLRPSPTRQSLRRSRSAVETIAKNQSSVTLPAPYDLPLGVVHEDSQTRRMDDIEKQIANLAGLVQHALRQAPSSSGGRDMPSDSLQKGSPDSGVTNGGESPDPKSPDPVPVHLQASLACFSRSIADLRIQLQQIKQLQLHSQETLKLMLKQVEQEIEHKVAEVTKHGAEPAQKQRKLVEEERQKYLSVENSILMQLGELEAYVLDLKKKPSLSQRGTLSTTSVRQIEEAEAQLGRVGESMSSHKSEFPSLQAKMRVVLRAEVEAVRFLKEEPHKLESMVKRVENLTHSLRDLRNTAVRFTPESSEHLKAAERGGPQQSAPLTEPKDPEHKRSPSLVSSYRAQEDQVDHPSPSSPSTHSHQSPTVILRASSSPSAKKASESRHPQQSQCNRGYYTRILQEPQCDSIKTAPSVKCMNKDEEDLPEATFQHQSDNTETETSTPSSGKPASIESTEIRKSPPPPPPRRSLPPCTGLTTGRSGEVIFTSRIEPITAQEGENPSLQPKPGRAVPQPVTPPPIAASAIQEEEDEGDKIMAELQVFQKCVMVEDQRPAGFLPPCMTKVAYNIPTQISMDRPGSEADKSPCEQESLTRVKTAKRDFCPKPVKLTASTSRQPNCLKVQSQYAEVISDALEEGAAKHPESELAKRGPILVANVDLEASPSLQVDPKSCQTLMTSKSQQSSSEEAEVSPSPISEEGSPTFSGNIAFMITDTQVQALSDGEVQQIVSSEGRNIQTVTIGSNQELTTEEEAEPERKPVIIIFDEPMDIRSAYKRLSTVFECEEELDRIGEDADSTDSRPNLLTVQGGISSALNSRRHHLTAHKPMDEISKESSGHLVVPEQTETKNTSKQGLKKKFKLKFPKKQLAALSQAVQTGSKTGKKTLQVVVYEDEEESDGTLKQCKEATRFEISHNLSTANSTSDTNTAPDTPLEVPQLEEPPENVCKSPQKLETSLGLMVPRGYKGQAVKEAEREISTDSTPDYKPNVTACRKQSKPKIPARPAVIPSPQRCISSTTTKMSRSGCVGQAAKAQMVLDTQRQLPLGQGAKTIRIPQTSTFSGSKLQTENGRTPSAATGTG